MTYTPTPEIKKIYDDARADLLKRDLSNTENFDKSILTYSSAGLALSLGFLKDFVSMHTATYPWLLYCSWMLFVLAILTTLASFLISQRGIDQQLKTIYSYYMEGNATAIDERNKYSEWLHYSSYIAGAAFLVALTLTTLFVAINLDKEPSMSDQNSLINKGASVPQIPRGIGRSSVLDGASIPSIQPTTSTAPPPAPAPSTPKPAGK